MTQSERPQISAPVAQGPAASLVTLTKPQSPAEARLAATTDGKPTRCPEHLFSTDSCK